jgi:hypothetical protein
MSLFITFDEEPYSIQYFRLHSFIAVTISKNIYKNFYHFVIN